MPLIQKFVASGIMGYMGLALTTVIGYGFVKLVKMFIGFLARKIRESKEKKASGITGGEIDE